MANIAIYGSHNGGIAIEDDGNFYVIVFERFFNLKNTGLSQYKPLKYRSEAVYAVLQYIEKELGFKPPFDTMIHGQTECSSDDIITSYKDLIPAKNVYEGYHHHAHASGSFYQSDFDKALIFSFDGGGNDGFFNVFIADRSHGVSYLDKSNPTQPIPNELDLGFPYMCFAHFCEDIKQEWISDGNLVYSGKIMGLCNYGIINYDWLPHFIKFYQSKPEGMTYIEKLNEIIGIPALGSPLFDENKRLKGQLAYNIAATSQKAFEDCFFDIISPYILKYNNLPIIITGGCALNILHNTKFKQKYPNKKLFIAPNSNDCGIALGYLANLTKPKKPIDITYGGMEVFDKAIFPAWVESNHARPVNINSIVTELEAGKIFGIIRGRCEHGPRSLGNRSIICNPAFPMMKDILNSKVKHREWYRPFAPIVRLEDVSEYFEWEGESRYMMFCPKVKDKWRSKLEAITHVDGTARVQTITASQNPWLYNLITEFKKHTGFGVLLNTSFNIAGKPILNTIADAVTLVKNSSMDYLIIEDFYYNKRW